MKKVLLLIAVLFTGVQCVPAQEFVINPWGWDLGSVSCYKAERGDTCWQVSYGTSKSFDEGFKFQSIATADDGDYYIFKHEDEYYAALKWDLAFSPDNPDGVENPLDERIQRRATRVGRFYGTMESVKCILIIFAVAALIAILYLKTRARILRPFFIVVIPVAILLVSAIEIYGFLMFDEHLFWWSDYDHLGFWGALVCLIPFGIVTAAQLSSLRVYERGLFINSDSPKKISIKPLAISLVVSFPLAVATLIILELNHLDKTWFYEPLVIGVFVISLGIGLLITLKRNISAFGLVMGLLITLFSIVYIIGCIIFVCALIALAFQLLIQILMVIGAIIMLMFIAPKRRFRGSDGRIYEEI